MTMEGYPPPPTPRFNSPPRPAMSRFESLPHGRSPGWQPPSAAPTTAITPLSTDHVSRDRIRHPLASVTSSRDVRLAEASTTASGDRSINSRNCKCRRSKCLKVCRGALARSLASRRITQRLLTLLVHFLVPALLRMLSKWTPLRLDLSVQ